MVRSWPQSSTITHANTVRYKCMSPLFSIVMANDSSGPTNSIEDMLDMSLNPDDDSPLLSDEPFWFYEGEPRGLAFVVLWDENGYPPRRDLDAVERAILDDESHEYRVAYSGEDTRTVSATGLALFAYTDDDADVEVID